MSDDLSVASRTYGLHFAITDSRASCPQCGHPLAPEFHYWVPKSTETFTTMCQDFRKKFACRFS